MPNLFDNSSTSWARYSDYEWRTGKDGVEYLMPTGEAKANVYDPMKVHQELVLAAMDTGMKCFTSKPGTRPMKKEAIRQFACKYGMLGLITALPTTAYFTQYEKVYLPRNQFIREETMDTGDYINVFFPFQKPFFRKHGRDGYHWMLDTTVHDKTSMAMAMTFEDESIGKAMSFTRDYGERFDWLEAIFREWAFILVSCFLYYTDRDARNPQTATVIHQAMRAFDRNIPTYHVRMGETPKLVWNLSSLLVTIQLMMSQGLTDQEKPLHLCARCQRSFFADRPDSYFCSDKCRKEYKDKYGIDKFPM